MNVIDFSQKTKEEADDLLRHGKVLEILSKYGEATLTGSYKYDLMYGPDIDINVLTDKPEESATAALKDFVEQRNFQKYQLGDFIKFPRENRPHGMIVVLIQEYRGRRWEIEIWFQESVSENDVYFDKLLSTATDEQRKAILELKHKREQGGLSKNSLDSASIYKQVLIEGEINI